MIRKKTVFFAALFFLLLFTITVNAQTLLSWNFEDGFGGFTENAWTVDKNVTEYSISDEGRDGSKCACIENMLPNDARLVYNVNAKSGTYYKISGWVRTLNVGEGDNSIGGNISVLNTKEIHGDLKGNNDWTYVEFYGKTASDQTNFTVALRLGGYSGDNSGKVWFDDIDIEELDSKPAVSEIQDLTDITNTGNEISNNTQSDSKNNLSQMIFPTDDIESAGVVLLLALLFVFVLVYRSLKVNNKLQVNAAKKGKSPKKTKVPINRRKHIAFAVMMFLALVIRLLLAKYMQGYDVDINCFKSWASHAASVGVTNFYPSVTFCDYPAGYMWVLYILGMISSVFPKLDMNFLVKIPAIICDLAIGGFIYYVCNKKAAKNNSPITYGWSIFLVCVWLFNPVVILDSSIWGQVDSVLTVFVVLAVYFMSEDKIMLSSLFYAFALLVKLQGIIFLPILFFLLVKKKKLEPFIKAAAVFLATIYAVSIPFSVKMKSPVIWVVGQFFGSANGYKYTTANAMNLYYMFNKNGVKDVESILFWKINLFSVGVIFLVAVVLLVWWLFHKSRGKYYLYFFSAAIMMGIFTFGPRMHERYFFPVTALLLLAAIFANDSKILMLFAGTSITGFFNVLIIYANAVNGHPWPKISDWSRLTALANVVITIIMFVYAGYKIKRGKGGNKFWITHGKEKVNEKI
ncbi:MAG: glycosyltransferase 87 family protein [Clostridiales bacterium]|jgi:Gpi18-like mannosyltransferase|nr:glycosyltransferase 87 family protein [Clostridiales bacterium]